MLDSQVADLAFATLSVAFVFMVMVFMHLMHLLPVGPSHACGWCSRALEGARGGIMQTAGSRLDRSLDYSCAVLLHFDWVTVAFPATLSYTSTLLRINSTLLRSTHLAVALRSPVHVHHINTYAHRTPTAAAAAAPASPPSPGTPRTARRSWAAPRPRPRTRSAGPRWI